MSNILTVQMNQQYILAEKLYENPGVSAFYYAIDQREGRDVGIKVVKAAKKDLPLMKKEARLLQQFLEKGCLVPALYATHYDERNEQFYLIMQYLKHMSSLDEVLKGELSIKTKLKVFRALLLNLRIIHAEKVQHRDLKPQNIMVNRVQEQVYILDFNLTGQNIFVGEGSNIYQAPEQIASTKYNQISQVDVFAIGVMMFEAFTNVTPLIGEHYTPDRPRMNWRFFQQPIELNPEISKGLNDFIVKCMAINPKDRYRDAGDMYRNLMKIRA